MLRRLLTLDTRLHARIEAMMARHGVLYPWWIPMTCVVGQLVCVTGALLQRDALLPPSWLALTMIAVVAVPLAHFVAGIWLPWWLDGIGTLLAAGVLMADPVTSGIDLAPALLAFLAAEAVARDGFLRGGAVGAVSVALVVTMATTAGLNDAGIYLLEVSLGTVVGAMLWWQMRALAAERAARAQAWDRATTAERERIAREIHDLVAHSLSVSLLQITGARHSLHDLREVAEDDPEEAARALTDIDEALADAEAVGRRAMADIRRTVAAMRSEAGAQALPAAADIETLVAQTAAAGMPVTVTITGRPETLDPSVGLGLYRIAQESLANIARHGGTGTAEVEFQVGRNGSLLRITNPTTGGRGGGDGHGSGLAGMQARATQIGATLSAGPIAGPSPRWQVEVRLPGPGPTRDGWLDLGTCRIAGEPA